MKYLVTGGCGFIGSNYILQLLASTTDIEVVNVDCLTYAGRRENLVSVEQDPRYKFYLADIRHPDIIDRIFQIERPDVVVAFAAESHVDRSIESANAFIHTNIVGTFYLLEAARKFGIGTFIQIGTDEVYGQVPSPQSSIETDPLDPRSPYSSSKASSDLLSLSYYTTHGLPVVVTRCCLSGDTRIPVLYNNKQDVFTIKNLADMDPKQIQQIMIKGFDPTTKQMGWYCLQDAFKKKNTKRMLKITTRYGRSVSLTEDHVVFRLIDDVSAYTSLPVHRKIPREIEEKQAKDIRVGDKIALSGKAFEDGTKSLDDLDMLSFIKASTKLRYTKVLKQNLSSEDNLKLKEFCKKSGQNYGFLRYRCSRGGYLPIEAFDVKDDDLIFLSQHNSAIPAKIKINEEVLWLLGLIVAEGCVSIQENHNYSVVISSDEVFIDRAVDIIQKYFKLSTKKRWDYNGVPTCHIRSKILVLYLQHLLELGKSKYTKLSPIIRQLPKSQLVYFLLGLFHGDGIHFGKTKDNVTNSKYKVNKFSISTASKDFAEDLVDILGRFNIIASFQSKVVYLPQYGNYNAYQVEAYGLENIEPDLWSERPSKDKTYLTANRDGDIIWTHVTAIEEIKSEEYVYDLTVSDVHNFSTIGGILVHNCNNYGPRQFPEKLIPLFVTNLMDGKQVPVYGDGRQVREWIHVDDHNKAIDFVIANGQAGQIYNIGSGIGLENITITRKLLEGLARDDSFIKHVEDRKGHDRRYSINCSKLQKLGWKLRHNFEEGLASTIKWYIDNQDWWRALKNE